MALEILVGVRGESFINDDGSSRQDIIRTLRVGTPVELVADPLNPHDRHAVKVLTPAGLQIGFLPSSARDADAVLKGEPISAVVHAAHGGTNWFQRLLGKRSVGVVLKLRKTDPDWSRRAQMEAIAAPIDAQVQAALAVDDSGEAPAAIVAMRAVIARIYELTRTNPYVSAHRRLPAPVDRLSLLLERTGRFSDALQVIEAWQCTFDPVQPGAQVGQTLRKRAERLRAKIHQRNQETPVE
jgi:hypothetical protein